VSRGRVVAGRRRGLSRRLLPLPRAGGEGALRGAEAGGFAGPDLHARRPRPPPGPPARFGADLEHVPRPPDPRVRGAEVGRRPERAERVRAAFGRAPGAEDRAPPRALPVPARQALVHGRPLPWARAPPRDGSQLPDAVRRGVS